MPDKPRIVKVEDQIQEGTSARTLLFRDEIAVRGYAGQFFMVWVPGFDEAPMSLSYSEDPQYAAITVQKGFGAAEKLYGTSRGEYFGIRGPYGRGFREIDDGYAILLGGEYGLASIAVLARRLAAKGVRASAVVAGKSTNDLIFHDKIQQSIEKCRGRVVAVTEDGSTEVTGRGEEGLELLLKESNPNTVYAYGPETTMYRAFLMTEKRGIKIQAAVDRIMKCGFGICGSCCLGRYLTCVDGPIFDNKALREVTMEFGTFYRDGAGRAIALKSPL